MPTLLVPLVGVVLLCPAEAGCSRAFPPSGTWIPQLGGDLILGHSEAPCPLRLQCQQMKLLDPLPQTENAAGPRRLDDGSFQPDKDPGDAPQPSSLQIENEAARPEIGSGIDMWATGCILAELLGKLVASQARCNARGSQPRDRAICKPSASPARHELR